MEATHFGGQNWPFRNGLDTRFYYPATSHEQALTRLLRALGEEEGLMLLTGAPGTGKTLLCHCLLQRLGEGVASALVTNSHFPDRAGLLQAILFDLALPYEGKGEQELRLNLTDQLLKEFAAGKPTVLVIDEAQLLTPDLLEELRLLGNLEGGGGQAVQVVLVGQPEVLEILERPELAGFRQRLAVRVHLEPLNLHEAADYLLHHLRSAGGQPERLISDEALEVLARGTGGIARVLNQAAKQAFGLALANGAPAVDAEAALEALAVLGLDAAAGEALSGEMEANPADVDHTPLSPADEAAKLWESRLANHGDEKPPNALYPSMRRPA